MGKQNKAIFDLTNIADRLEQKYNTEWKQKPLVQDRSTPKQTLTTGTNPYPSETPEGFIDTDTLKTEDVEKVFQQDSINANKKTNSYSPSITEQELNQFNLDEVKGNVISKKELPDSFFQKPEYQPEDTTAISESTGSPKPTSIRNKFEPSEFESRVNTSPEGRLKDFKEELTVKGIELDSLASYLTEKEKKLKTPEDSDLFNQEVESYNDKLNAYKRIVLERDTLRNETFPASRLPEDVQQFQSEKFVRPKSLPEYKLYSDQEADKLVDRNKFYDTPIGELAGSVTQGMFSIAEGSLGFGEYIGDKLGMDWLKDASKDGAENVKGWMAQVAPRNPNFLHQTMSGLGSMMIFVPFGGLVGTAAKMISTLSPKVANLVGMSGASFLEAATEAGAVYQESKDPSAAEKSFLANMILIGLTNKFGIFSENAEGLKKALLSAPLEALQEGGQSIISSTSQGKEIDWDEVLTSTAIGGIVGGVTGFAMPGQQQQQVQGLTDEEKSIDDIARGKLNPDLAQVTVPDDVNEEVKELVNKVANGHNNLNYREQQLVNLYPNEIQTEVNKLKALSGQREKPETDLTQNISRPEQRETLAEEDFLNFIEQKEKSQKKIDLQEKSRIEEGQAKKSEKKKLQEDQGIYSEANRQWQNARRNRKLFDERVIADLADKVSSPDIKSKLEGIYSDALAHNKRMKQSGVSEVVTAKVPEKKQAEEIPTTLSESVQEEKTETPSNQLNQREGQQRTQGRPLPTEAQLEAGNYKKEHIRQDGFEISIENKKGSIRSGKDKSGKPWQVQMNNDYGYIRGTVGKDKDHLDVFLAEDYKEDSPAYIVNQTVGGKFDEHKVMLGFTSKEEAEAAYKSNYEEGKANYTDIVEMPMDEFKKWAKDESLTKKPAKIKTENEPVSSTQVNIPEVRYNWKEVENSIKQELGDKPIIELRKELGSLKEYEYEGLQTKYANELEKLDATGGSLGDPKVSKDIKRKIIELETKVDYLDELNINIDKIEEIESLNDYDILANIGSTFNKTKETPTPFQRDYIKRLIEEGQKRNPKRTKKQIGEGALGTYIEADASPEMVNKLKQNASKYEDLFIDNSSLLSEGNKTPIKIGQNLSKENLSNESENIPKNIPADEIQTEIKTEESPEGINSEEKAEDDFEPFQPDKDGNRFGNLDEYFKGKVQRAWGNYTIPFNEFNEFAAEERKKIDQIKKEEIAPLKGKRDKDSKELKAKAEKKIAEIENEINQKERELYQEEENFYDKWKERIAKDVEKKSGIKLNLEDDKDNEILHESLMLMFEGRMLEPGEIFFGPFQSAYDSAVDQVIDVASGEQSKNTPLPVQAMKTDTEKSQIINSLSLVKNILEQKLGSLEDLSDTELKNINQAINSDKISKLGSLGFSPSEAKKIKEAFRSKEETEKVDYEEFTEKELYDEAILLFDLPLSLMNEKDIEDLKASLRAKKKKQGKKLSEESSNEEEQIKSLSTDVDPDFLSDDKMRRGKAVKTIVAPVRYQGKITNEKKMVEDAIENNSQVRFRENISVTGNKPRPGYEIVNGEGEMTEISKSAFEYYNFLKKDSEPSKPIENEKVIEILKQQIALNNSPGAVTPQEQKISARNISDYKVIIERLEKGKPLNNSHQKIVNEFLESDQYLKSKEGPTKTEQKQKPIVKAKPTASTWQEAVLEYLIQGGKIREEGTNFNPKRLRELGVSNRNISAKGTPLDKLISNLGFSDISYQNDFNESALVRELLYKYDSHEKRVEALKQLRRQTPIVQKDIDEQYEKRNEENNLLDNIILNNYLDTDGNLRTSEILKDSNDILKQSGVDESVLLRYLKDKQEQPFEAEQYEDVFADFIENKEITSERTKEIIEVSKDAELNELAQDIVSKAESNSETRLNEAVQAADEVINPSFEKQIKKFQDLITSEEQTMFGGDPQKIQQYNNEIKKVQARQAEAEAILGLEADVVKKQKSSLPKSFDIDGSSLSELKVYKTQLENIGSPEDKILLDKITRRIEAMQAKGKQEDMFAPVQEDIFASEPESVVEESNKKTGESQSDEIESLREKRKARFVIEEKEQTFGTSKFTKTAKGEEQFIEIDNYGRVPAQSFFHKLIENGRLPNEMREKITQRFTDEYYTDLLNKNLDLFPEQFKEDQNKSSKVNSNLSDDQLESMLKDSTEKLEEIQSNKVAKEPSKLEIAHTKQIKKLEKEIASRKKTPEEKKNLNDIQDFGEKIGGAKKDYYTTLTDAKKLDIAKEPLSKTFPVPDYEKLIQSGVEPRIVGLVRAMRDEIPNKPVQSWKLKRYVEQVTLLREFADELLSGEVKADRVFDELNKMQLQEIKDVVELYTKVGHSKSLKGIRIRFGSYNIYDGEKHDPPKTIWSVEQRAKATAFSNFPRRLSMGNTREEAINKFVDNYDKFNEGGKKHETKFSVYKYRGKDDVWIGKKVGRGMLDLKKFPSTKEAKEYLKNNREDLENLLQKAKEIPESRREFNEERLGESWRNGKNVTPEQFTEAFRFRGVEFGNWVNVSGERQQALNDAYDALMDLAKVLDIPTQALSLNGELGLAFGARGSGGRFSVAAHYEPDKIVINLTRKKGAGSLAHEWWHALDNYMSRSRKYPNEYLSERPHQLGKEFELKNEVIESFNNILSKIKNTDIIKRSKNLDKRRSTPYWATLREITARVFENYVIEKLQREGYSNDYLANIVTKEDYIRDLITHVVEGENNIEDIYPYLEKNEIPPVVDSFDNFFNNLEAEKVGDNVRINVLPTEAKRENNEPVDDIDRLNGNPVDFGVGLGQVFTTVSDQIQNFTARRKAEIELGIRPPSNLHPDSAKEFLLYPLDWTGEKLNDTKLQRGYREWLTAPAWFVDKNPQLQRVWDVIDRHHVRDMNYDLSVIREDVWKNGRSFRKLKENSINQIMRGIEKHEAYQYDLQKNDDAVDLPTFEEFISKYNLDEEAAEFIRGTFKPTIEKALDYVQDLDRYKIINLNLNKNPYLEEYFDTVEFLGKELESVIKSQKRTDEEKQKLLKRVRETGEGRKKKLLNDAKQRFFDLSPNAEIEVENAYLKGAKTEVEAINNAWKENENLRLLAADELIEEKYKDIDGKFYFPSSRLDKKYYLSGFKDVTDPVSLLMGDKPDKYFTTSDEPAKLLKIKSGLEAEGYQVTSGKFKDAQEEILKNIVTQEDILDLALLAGIEPDNKVLNKLIKNIISKGFAKHFIHKKYIPGFDYTKENFETAIHKHINAVTYYKNRNIGNFELEKTTNDLKTKKILKPGSGEEKYIEDLRQRLDTRDVAASKALRAVASLYYLAGRVSYLVQQIVQPLNTLLPYLPVVARELGLKSSEAEKAFGESMVTTLQYWAWKVYDKTNRIQGKPTTKNFGLDSEFLDVIKKLERMGVGKPLRSLEILGEQVDPAKYYKPSLFSGVHVKDVGNTEIRFGFIPLVKIAGIPGILVEDFTRTQGIRAYYNLAKKAGLSGDKLLDFISLQVARSYGAASGVQSKPPGYTLPGKNFVSKGAQTVVDSYLTFKNFGFMNFGQWGKAWRELRDNNLLRPVLYKVGAQVGLGGLKYMMWTSSILTLMSGLYGLFDVPEDPEKQYEDLFKEFNKVVPGLGDVLYRGLASVTFKVDLSALFAQTAPFVSEDIQFQDSPLETVGGAGAGVVIDITRGQPPSAIKNLKKAEDYEKKGVSLGGKNLIPGEEKYREQMEEYRKGKRKTLPEKPITEAEQSAKKLGFTPLRVSKAYAKENQRQFASGQMGDIIRSTVKDRIIPLINSGKNHDARGVFLELYKKAKASGSFTELQDEKIINVEKFISSITTRLDEEDRKVIITWRDKFIKKDSGGKYNNKYESKYKTKYKTKY